MGNPSTSGLGRSWAVATILGACLGAPAALAATPAEVIVAALAARAEKPIADVELTGLVLPADVPADADFEVALPNYALHAGSVTLKLSAAGETWSVRGQVAFWAALPVATQETRPGDPVVLRVERRREVELLGSKAIDPTLEWRATGTLHVGQVALAGRVERVPDRVSGSEVTVLVRRGAVELRAPGRLLADGVVGQAVSVLNLATKVQQHGTLQIDGSVLLGDS